MSSLLKDDHGRYYYYYDDYTEYCYGYDHSLSHGYCFGSHEAREQHKVFYTCQDISLHWDD